MSGVIGVGGDHETPGLSPDAQEELGYYRGLRFLLLARAYES